MKIIFVQYRVALSFMNNMCHLHFYFDPGENIDNRISYLHRNPCNNIIVTKSNDIMSLIGKNNSTEEPTYEACHCFNLSYLEKLSI